MYVYVKFEGLVKVISNVTIGDDCGPVVEGKLVSDSPLSGEGAVNSRNIVDAILWFKSLPMEAVYLDCNARDAKWCPKSVRIQESNVDENERSSTPKVSVRLRKKSHKVHIDTTVQEKEDHPYMPESARPLFSDHPGVVDFNPIIDEMFERAEELVRSWDRLSEAEIYKEIAQILHCYVFPAVSFQQEDIPVLQECQRLIIVRQETVEKDITDTEKNIDITEKYLNKQKEIIMAIEGMTTQSYLCACDTQFLESFYMHVIKDIQKKNSRLESIQIKINELKKTGEDPEKRERLKKERDSVHEIVQKLIVIREALRNHLYRPFISKKKKKLRKEKLSKKDVNLHSVFQQVHQQFVEHKDHLKKLCYRKLYTSSVREAIESTIKMVQQDSPRGLGDFSEFSIYIGNDDVKKQWQSMQAKVDEWVKSNNSLSHSHMEGCQLVRDLANGILSDSQVASMGLEGSQEGGEAEGEEFEMNAIASAGGLSEGSSEVDGQSGRSDAGNDLFYKRAPMVRVMKDQVNIHTWEIAERIVNLMEFQVCPGNRHINRAWVCYGPYFWQEAGEAVEQVYTHFEAPKARKVYRIISSVSLADIMDSTFFRDFFTQRVSQMSSNSVEESSEECAAGVGFKCPDTVSAVSLDLMRCSVSDLYAKVNRDGARLNYEMLELEALYGSHLSVHSNSSVENGDHNKTAVQTTTVPESETEMNCVKREELVRSDSSTSDSGASIHSGDLFDTGASRHSSQTDTVRSSQTVASVLSLFEVIVGPYHEKVQAILEASDVMEKMRAVWISVDFLCQKAGEICKARGMDSLLPLSIFAISSFSEDLFVKYYIQLLILMDLKPSFAFHSMYDFSLTSAISSYMYLFQAKFPVTAPASDESDG